VQKTQLCPVNHCPGLISPASSPATLSITVRFSSLTRNARDWIAPPCVSATVRQKMLLVASRLPPQRSPRRHRSHALIEIRHQQHSFNPFSSFPCTSLALPLRRPLPSGQAAVSPPPSSSPNPLHPHRQGFRLISRSPGELAACPPPERPKKNRGATPEGRAAAAHQHSLRRGQASRLGRWLGSRIGPVESQ
jgi:hypothetical protein